MKKIITVLLACILFVAGTVSAFAVDIDYSALTDAELDELIREATAERGSRQTVHSPVTVRTSPDKYTWYIQDYVGRNAAGFGYTSLGGDRLEKYGAGYLEFVFVAEDGAYIDINDEALLQKYIVTGQNLAPDTEMKYVFQKDSHGKEYSNLIDFQSIRQIDLAVKRIDGTTGGDPVAFELIPINASTDRHIAYIRNYVGKNVASFGYASLGGDRRDKYGVGNIKFNFVADDGVYLDPENTDILKQYVVTAQDIAPNSKMKFDFMKNSKGEEYSNLIESQTYGSITLYVHKLDLVYPETAVAVAEPVEQSVPTEKAVAAEPTAEPVTADGTVQRYEDVRYRLLSDGNIEICGYTRAQSFITVPSKIDGRKVTKIADGAFENCTALQDLIVWADLTDIGVNAFKGCTGLSYISLPSSLTYIAESAFENCTGLSSVIIWGDITGIGKNAFKNCRSLEDVSIPSSCKVIGESAFEGCTDLETVILWGSTNIGNSAFRGCVSLDDISISSGTEYIGDYAFEGCTGLETVIMWGRSTRIGRDAFANCPKLQNPPR